MEGDDRNEQPAGDPAIQTHEGEEDSDVVEITEDDLVEFDEGAENPEGDVIDDMDDMELEEEERDDSDFVFQKHEGSVFCVDVDPATSSLAVTGGEDDKAYVWKAATGEILFPCTGHKDSVTCVGFSHDSSLVATGDMGGLIKVWNVQSKEEVWSFEVADLEWMVWHHAAPVLVAGTSDGDMWMWKLPGGECRTLQTHGSSCGVGRLFPDGRRVCAGYEDGTVKVWDLKSSAVLQTFSRYSGHHGAVTCLACHHDNNLILSGSTDKTAKMLSSQNGKVLATFACSGPGTNGEEDDSVEAAGFSPIQNLAATGTLKGMLTIWDITTQKSRHQCPHQTGIVRLLWDNTSPLVYTGALDGAVRLYDSRTGSCEGEWFGHQAELLDFSVAKDGSFMVTAGGDNTARQFLLRSPDR